MALSPEVLLRHAARLRCIENVKNLPVFTYKDASYKINASVLIPLCVVNGEVSLLYTLRSLNMSTHSGQVSFPGGKRDQNETEIETALRETEEEIGVAREDVDIWTKMSEVQGRNKDILITPVVGYIKNFSISKLKANIEEVDEIFTVPIKTFCDTNNHGYFNYNNLMIPVFLCGKHKVWGITGLITHVFLECFLPKSIYKADFPEKQFEINDLMSSKL